MKNRTRYITQKNEFDLMMNILKSGACPIRAVTGVQAYPMNEVCKEFETRCSDCIQRWMNKEDDENEQI